MVVEIVKEKCLNDNEVSKNSKSRLLIKEENKVVFLMIVVYDKKI